MIIGPNNIISLVPNQAFLSSPYTSTTHIIDGATDQIAFKFFAMSTMPITAIDVYLGKTGSPVCDIVVELQTDDGGTGMASVPSGTVLGAGNNAKTAAIAGYAGNAWTGLTNLGESTGNLTVGTPYWVVIKINAATTLDGSNYYRALIPGATTDSRMGQLRAHNGTNWTTITASNGSSCGWVAKLYDGVNTNYFGNPVVGPMTTYLGNDIYDQYVQGLKIKFGAQVYIHGVIVYFYKTGTGQNDLICYLYEGTTLKATSVALDDVLMGSGQRALFWFSSPFLCAANTVYYFVLKQNGTDGTDSIDYDSYAHDLSNDAYRECIINDDCIFNSIYGDFSGSDPTSLTVLSDRYVPLISPVILSPYSDLVSGGGGGGKILIDGAWKSIQSAAIMIAGAWKAITN